MLTKHVMKAGRGRILILLCSLDPESIKAVLVLFTITGRIQTEQHTSEMGIKDDEFEPGVSAR